MKSLRHIGRKSRLWAAVVLVLFIFGGCMTPWGRAVDIFFHDIFFGLRGPRAPAKDIVIVAIDEPSFGLLEMQWPWPRSVHAGLLDALYAAGARSVAFDVLFADPSTPGEDAVLRQAFLRYPSLVLAADIDQVATKTYARDTIVGPHPSLTGPRTSTGLIYLPVDPDGFIRRPPAATPVTQTLSGRAVLQFLGKEHFKDRGFKQRINFAGPHRTFATISYYQALAPESHLPGAFLKDKLVFVGLSTQNTPGAGQAGPDHFPTPFTRWGDGYMSGVEIHATLADNLLLGNGIRVLPVGWIFFSAIVLCLGAGRLFFSKSLKTGAFLVAFCWAAAGMGSFLLFSRACIYVSFLYLCLPLTGLYLVSPFFRYMDSRRERKFIQQAFSTYVAPGVVRQLIDDPGLLSLGGEERVITAFFSDIEGFTRISETLSPRVLVSLLNEFLTRMTDILLEHSGTVDKFEGDAVIAMFNAPNHLPDHPVQACMACIEMQEALLILNRDWLSRGLPVLKMRIGMATGPAVVGNMGSDRRMDYTMMGDTVNIASRLEGANKAYKTYCLVSESTRQAVQGVVETREIDTIRLAGRNNVVTAHEILGYPGRLTQNTLLLVDVYKKGLEAYRQREWKQAAEIFGQALVHVPEDGPARTMLARCREFAIHPPAQDWDGAWQVKK